MRNLAFAPAKRTEAVRAMTDVFHDGRADADWVKTSVSMRPETKARLKVFAAGHDLKIQEVVDEALTAWMDNQN